MESIEIKNFGPIQHVKLDLRDINVFIGPTASGKSTVAKLVAIARDSLSTTETTLEAFARHLVKYNINFKGSSETYIKYLNRESYWEMKGGKIESNNTNTLSSKLADTLNQLAEFMGGIRLHKIPDEPTHARERVKNFLIGMALLGGFTTLDNVVKQEGNEEFVTDEVKHLLSVAKDYKAKFNMNEIDSEDNAIVIDQLLNDPRLSRLLPLIGANMFPDQLVYIPAERSLLAMIGQSIFGLMSNNVSITEIVKDFGSKFELARKQLRQLPLSLFDAEYKYVESDNIIVLPDGTEIKLEHASSGFQSAIPLLLVIKAVSSNKGHVFNRCFVTEEPELNLYPTAQKEVVNFIVECINQSGDKLILTTHSPYILTALDNLIQAHNAIRKSPEVEEEVKKLVPAERWVDFDRVACYYFENGTCRSTMDEEYRSIGPSNIDDVSEELGKVYDKLLDLEYAKVP